jgi:hypothetical protein
MLQRLCENLQYANLLNRAANEPDRYIRLALVATFGVGGYAMNIYRTLKFFNPLLSETYEYIDNDMGFRYIAEQVSHHPAISACYAEGEGFNYYTNTNAESKFKIMKGCIEFQSIGRSYVNFTKFNDQVTYTKPKAVVRNLIMGKMHIDCYGKSVVTNKLGDICELEYIEETSKERGKLVGEVRDSYGNVKIRLEGNWLSQMDMIFIDDSGVEKRETIWKKAIISGNEEERFYFTDFSVNLNNLTDEMKQQLPPTDSRFRPDQRALEMQDYELASKEKHRLEEKQRQTRKIREKSKFKYKPVFFEETYDDLTGELIYLYNGTYWDLRNSKKFEKFYNIY